MTSLFNGAPDLLEDFKQFLPESAAAAQKARQAAEDTTPFGGSRNDAGYGSMPVNQSHHTPRNDQQKLPPMGNFAPTPTANRENKRKRGERQGTAAAAAANPMQAETSNLRSDRPGYGQIPPVSKVRQELLFLFTLSGDHFNHPVFHSTPSPFIPLCPSLCIVCTLQIWRIARHREPAARWQFAIVTALAAVAAQSKPPQVRCALLRTSPRCSFLDPQVRRGSVDVIMLTSVSSVRSKRKVRSRQRFPKAQRSLQPSHPLSQNLSHLQHL